MSVTRFAVCHACRVGLLALLALAAVHVVASVAHAQSPARRAPPSQINPLPTPLPQAASPQDRALPPDSSGASAPNADVRSEIRRRYSSTLPPEVIDRILGGQREDLLLLVPRSVPATNEVGFCLTSQPPNDFLEHAKTRFANGSQLRKVGCPFAGGVLRIASVDLAILERARLLDDLPFGSALFDALSTRAASLYDVVDANAFDLRRKRLANDAERPLGALREGKLTGFGMLIIDNKSRRICGSKSEDPDFLRQQAERMYRSVADSAIRAALQQDIDLMFIEDLYLKAKGNGCRYVIGRHQLLRLLLNTLSEDPVYVEMGPAWIPESELATDAARPRQ